MPSYAERAVTLADEIATLYPDQDEEATGTDPAVPAEELEILTIAQAIEAAAITDGLAADAATALAAIEPAVDSRGDLTPDWVDWLTNRRIPPATEGEIAYAYAGRTDEYDTALAAYPE